MPASEWFGLGKTTRLNCIAGIDRPTSGTVTVGGTDVTSLSEGALAKWRSRHVGFIFQFYNLIPVLTAVEATSFAPPAHYDMSNSESQAGAAQ
jgi:ABC-type lipoprotein export system ATPase subunit